MNCGQLIAHYGAPTQDVHVVGGGAHAQVRRVVARDGVESGIHPSVFGQVGEETLLLDELDVGDVGAWAIAYYDQINKR